MTFPAATTVPAAKAALFVMADAIANAKALYGPVRQWPKSDSLVIGWGRSGAVNHRMKPQGATGVYLETYDVMCAIHSQTPNDDTDMAARDVRAGEMFSALKAALFADPRLGGLVMKAIIGDSLQWFATLPGGASCDLEFSVHIEAAV